MTGQGLKLGLFAGLLGASLLIIVGGCGGRRLISPQEEVKLGREAAVDFEKQYGGRDHDPRRNAMAQSIGSRIAQVAVKPPYPNYPYEFRVLNNKTVNANAFPGGLIYFWRGLFEYLKYDEQQLAWVAGHEVAHIARQHSVRRIERALGYELVIQLVLGNDTAGKIAGAVAGLTLQDYGRDQELEADRLGLHLSHQAGYDPTAALAVIAAFKQLQGKDPSQLELMFATHPGNTTREEHIKAILKQEGWRGKYYP